MKPVFEKSLPRRSALGLIGAGALALLSPAARAAAAPSREITIYKSPYCGCCGSWTKILRKHGFEAKVFKMNDLSRVKQQAKLPGNLESCHTAVIDGYFVEGHVPVEAIEKMLTERPRIAGIAVGGMPSGSPGMPGPDPEPYDVVAYTADGRQDVYMSYR
ncbi:MAG: DUF411 domain-containing protein [Rhodospirillales bacterium]|nr:DUF411 domain-containing protein [Rhodospirillales bacterium]MDH3791043.1 DUF411 domain-containing protein [Rhodospirillales bacterium]MDH3910660.1 DUF411 domain-containing protein [Rhodospirillales bacterium]MDH3917751.1 DUF411 domain-containing protein [Rhodospirillales bacterium]MDH3965668.1 DUF411 domain-containing protein [Rhodospirillales bacterium]